MQPSSPLSLNSLFNTIKSQATAPISAATTLKSLAGHSPQPSVTGVVPVSAPVPSAAPEVGVSSLAALARAGLNPAPATAPIISKATTPVMVKATPDATPAQTSTIPPQWINPKGGLYTPEEVAANIAAAASAANPNGDIPKLAGDALVQGPQSTPQLQSTASDINNARNDIATGQTDPYKVASQSGVAYTPEELSAIEKAYAGVYDPALNSALSKLDAQQKADLATQTSEANAKSQEEVQAAAPYTLGADETRFDGQGNAIASGSSTAAANSDLNDYIKTTANGNQYVDLSTVTDPKEKAALQNAAQAANIPPVTDANASKLAAIDDTRSNLDQIASQFQKVGYKSGVTKALGGFGLSNDVASLFGNSDIGSFNAWRTAAINSIQALAGGTGSGIRINQAEINSAMENDIPNKSDNLATGAAKIAVLKSQLNNWENQLLGTTGTGTGTSVTPDEENHLKSLGYTDDQIKAYEDSSGKVSVGNTTASTNNGLNKPQRNNNPGDLKEGGLADSLAIGKDSDGTLIFSNPIDGQKALTLDLTAKVNGASAHLPANPTLAQLGSVYATDPKWAAGVAKYLGLPVNTPTQNIPITKLASAIARQEGYFS